MNKLAAVIIVLISSVCAMAQADTVVSLVTCYAGTDIYELEGHEAIRINMGSGHDYAVSYGEFDFNAPGFVYRFVKGETDYMVGMFPWAYFEDAYRRAGRRVVEKRLDMTQAQKDRLMQLVADNLRPENRVYRYNYVKDNCATRPLRTVELAMGDTIMLGASPVEGRAQTFREVMRHFHRNYPWYQFGIDLALGAGIDYPIDRREMAFAPIVLCAQLDSATCGGKPLVSETIVLVDLPEDNAVEDATPWYLSPLAVCWAVFALLLWCTIFDLRRGKVTRWVDALYFGLMGLAGCLLTFLIFVSLHEATSPNWLFVWLNPFCLIPTIFIWLKKCKRVVLLYQIANFALILTLIVAWAFLPQSANAAFLPLVLGDAMRAASYVYITKNEANT